MTPERIVVAHVIDSMDVGGAQRQLLNLFRAVDPARFDLRLVCLRDGSGVSGKTVLLPPRAFMIAALFDGEHTLDEIRAEYAARFGEPILAETIQDVLRQLDEAQLLEK